MAAAASSPAPPKASRPASTIATPAVMARAISASLCAPPTTCTSTRGLSATSAAAPAGSEPREAATREAINAVTSTLAAAIALSDQTAPATPTRPSGSVARVKRGP